MQEEDDNFPLPAGDKQLFIKAASEFLRRRAGFMCTKPCAFLASLFLNVYIYIFYLSLKEPEISTLQKYGKSLKEVSLDI